MIKRIKPYIIQHMMSLTKVLWTILAPLSVVLLGLGIQLEFVFHTHIFAVLLWWIAGVCGFFGLLSVVIFGVLSIKDDIKIIKL